MSAYKLIAAEQANFPIGRLCGVLGVSRSGFYAWSTRAPSDGQLTDAWLTEQIREIHAENREVYGAPRIHAELRLARGVRVGRKRVERLMKDAGISGLVAKKRGRTTIRVPGVRVADDLVERDFKPAGPNVLWVADITYLRTWEGWLYLAAVQDAYSRRIVGWSMTDHMRSDLVVDALNMAIARRQPETGLIHHTRSPAILADTRGTTHRRLRLHRDLLQRHQEALHARDALSRGVREDHLSLTS